MSDSYKDNPLTPEEGSKVWSHDRFVGKMIWATKHHPIAYSDLPDIVDLSQGKVGENLNILVDETMKDPNRREHAKSAKVGIDGKIHIPKELTVGHETHVSIKGDLYIHQNLLVPHYSQKEYCAFDMHSHGIIDLPPSPLDFITVLSSLESGGGQAFFVVTESARFLIFRTLDTPEFTNNEARQQIKYSMEQTERKASALRAAGFSSKQEIMQAEIRLQRELVQDMCEKYNLGLYISLKNNLFRKTSF